MAKKEKAKYDVEVTTYKKVKTGKKDDRGRDIYETQGEPVKKVRKNTNFSEIKKQVFDSSKGDENVFVNYEKPTYRISKTPARIKNVTKKNKDGSKTVTYYNAVKKR